MASDYKVLFRGLWPEGSTHAAGLTRDGSFTATIYDRRLSPYLAKVPEGGYVVDKWRCGHRADAVKIVLGSPLLDLKLPSGKVSEIDLKGGIFDGPGLLALGGEFQTLAAIKLQNEHKGGERWRGFDSVSLSEYLAIWRDYGARIGQRVGDKIKWEDGAEDTIPPEGDYAPHPVDACLDAPPCL